MAIKAQSISFLLSQVRASGVALAGGTVDAYQAGSTTVRKTIYQDRDKSVEADNPYQLDSNGTAQLFGDGLYRFVIKDSAGVTKYDRDYISIKEVAGNVYDVADYASLAAAVASIGSTPATLQFAADVTVSANLTIPSTLELMPLNGAKIQHNAYTISYAGSTARWPLAQVFNGLGAVTGLKESYPEWFGAVGDGATDDSSALSQAIQAGHTINLSPRTYAVGHLYLSGLSGVKLEGVPGKTIIKKLAGVYGPNQDGAISGIIDFVLCDSVTLDGIKFDGNKANALPAEGTQLNGVNFYRCTKLKTTRCEFVDVNFVALNHQCCYNAVIIGNYFKDVGWCGANFSGGYFDTFGAAECSITDNTFINIWAGVVAQIYTNYVHVNDNTFVNSTLFFSQGLKKSIILGNTFSGHGPVAVTGELSQDAIEIESASEVTIADNIIVEPARAGIYVVGNYIQNGPNEGILTCDDINIHDNFILNAATAGLELSPGSAYTYNMETHTGTATTEANYTYASRIKAIGNTVVGCGSGINIGNVDGAEITGNMVDKNVANGININSVKNLSLRGNRVTNNGFFSVGVYDGIALSSAVATLVNITIVGNDIYDSQASPTQRYGVYNPNAGAVNLLIDNLFYPNGSSVSASSGLVPNKAITPDLLNGAVAAGAPFAPPTYYKDSNGWVHLTGRVTLGSAGVGAAIINLPAGFRPVGTEIFPVVANAIFGRCDITSGGDVIATVATNSAFFSLAGISFKSE